MLKENLKIYRTRVLKKERWLNVSSKNKTNAKDKRLLNSGPRVTVFLGMICSHSWNNVACGIIHSTLSPAASWNAWNSRNLTLQKSPVAYCGKRNSISSEYELWINDTWVFIFALAASLDSRYNMRSLLEKTCIYFYLDRVFHLPCTVHLRLCCRVTLDYSVWFVVQIKGAVLRRNEKPPGQSESV